MSIPGSISTNTNMNNNLHQQQFIFDNLKNHPSNKIFPTSNFSFNPDLLRELNARYLQDMNANGFSTFHRSKNYHQHNSTSLNKLSKSDNNLSLSPTKKSNKWCTAHVRISWMIYHQQQQQRLKDKLSLLDKKKDEEQQSSLNNKLPDFISNTKSIFPFSSIDYRSPFDVSNSSFGGLGSLFPSLRKADINETFSPLNLNSSQFPHNIGLFSSTLNNPNKNSSSLLTGKANSDNFSKISSHSLPSTFPSFDPLTLSIIERQRLSTAYASLFASSSQGKSFLPMNIDPTIFRNNNSSNLFPNFDSSAMTTALIQREQFLNSLRLSQQQQHKQMIERERGTILNSNNIVQINKTLKTKFDQISPIKNEETKRIKLENGISHLSNSSTSSSIKSKHVKHEKRLSSPSSIHSTLQTHHLSLKEESIPSISITI